ncbi:GTPase activating protein 1-like isoform X1 [Curcuma longa]|uniref:GTPase activating protein 1-like isoform X1 n=1 Tax=Curcuma longa TaxID=136217 RepID=UPI003D9EB3BC
MSTSGLLPREKEMLGLLKVKVLRGFDLAVRDLRSSDPYVIVKMGKQKLKTRVIKRNTNPVWNEELTLSIEDPNLPVRLFSDSTLLYSDEDVIAKEVFDKDTFSLDDPMGHAEFDIRMLVEAVKMELDDLPNGTIITTVVPCRKNCLAEVSRVYWSDGTVFQDLILRLRNVERGEVELKLRWVSIEGSRDS